MRCRTTIITGAVLGTLLLAGCYPEQPDYINEYDLVYTNHSPSYDFTAHTTYALPDSVVQITGNLAEGEQPDMVSPVYGDVILGQIRQNLNAYGWTEVGVGDDPDVVVLAATVKTENINVYSYYGGYWGWYYPPYYGWGWYYPGYYPTYTSYTSGSLLMQMTVPADASANDNVPVVWLGIMNGLLEGSTASIQDRVRTSIDQAFAQSSYLKH